MTSLVLRKEDTHMFIDLFRDFNMNDLITAVESLTVDNLDNDSKGHAISIIKEWGTNVLSRLSQREQEMNSMVSYFDSNSPYQNERFSKYEEDLAEKSGTIDKFNNMAGLRREMTDLNNIEVLEYDKDPEYKTLTEEGKILAKQKYELDVFRRADKIRKARKKYEDSYKEWKTKIRALPAVCEMISKAKEYRRNVSRYKQECTDLSLMAKSNILVSNKDVRDVFKKMVNFSKEV